MTGLPQRSRLAILASALLLASLGFARWLTPDISGMSHMPGTIARGLPDTVGPWQAVAAASPMVELTVAGAGGQRINDSPYDEVVTRSYVGPQGRPIMLAIAYAAQQRQEVKIHRPDLCYPAQGWRLLAQERTTQRGLRDAAGPLEITRLLARKREQQEVVLYLLRTGDSYSQSMWAGRLAILEAGLRGLATDGVLVRVSQRLDAGDDPRPVQAELERFLPALLRHTAEDVRERLVPGWRPQAL